VRFWVFWLCIAPSPAARPLRDVDVTYKVPVPDGKDTTLRQRFRWSVAAQTQRVDLPGSGSWMVLDFARHRMQVVHDEAHEVMDVPAPPEAGVPGYTRAGDDTVAGLACTQWRTVDTRGDETLACYTPDGVLLRATSGGKVMMEAVSVSYAAQAPAVFQPPSGYTHQQSKP
jgi:hypothetical protein